MKRTVVLGIGNTLLSDDGVGVHAIRRLQQATTLPDDIQVVDGGTMGLSLLGYLEGTSRLVIVDAVETGGPPGTLVRLAGEEVPAYLSLKISPHDIGLPDLLFAAKLRDLYPDEVVVWGIQPASMGVGLDLSPPVSGQLHALVQKVLEELETDIERP